MAKGTMEFDMDDLDDNCKFQRAVRADEVFTLLWDLDQHCRAKIKWDESLPEDTVSILEEIRNMINGTGLLELFQ